MPSAEGSATNRLSHGTALPYDTNRQSHGTALLYDTNRLSHDTALPNGTNLLSHGTALPYGTNCLSRGTAVSNECSFTYHQTDNPDAITNTSRSVLLNTLCGQDTVIPVKTGGTYNYCCTCKI
jgi:hypothetical protein